VEDRLPLAQMQQGEQAKEEVEGPQWEAWPAQAEEEGRQWEAWPAQAERLALPASEQLSCVRRLH